MSKIFSKNGLTSFRVRILRSLILLGLKRSIRDFRVSVLQWARMGELSVLPRLLLYDVLRVVLRVSGTTIGC